MVPLQEAIDTRAWLTGEFSEVFLQRNLINFRIRPSKFSRIDLTAIDEPEKISPKLGLDANVWLLKCDIVNLFKREVHCGYITSKLRLVDEEGFEFMKVDDDHLLLQSQFSLSSGLNNFFSQELPPKIKRSGAIAFALPEFFEHLSIKVLDGTLSEL